MILKVHYNILKLYDCFIVFISQIFQIDDMEVTFFATELIYFRSGLEPGTCIFINRCDHWSSDCLKLFRSSFHVDENLWRHTSYSIAQCLVFQNVF